MARPEWCSQSTANQQEGAGWDWTGRTGPGGGQALGRCYVVGISSFPGGYGPKGLGFGGFPPRLGPWFAWGLQVRVRHRP